MLVDGPPRATRWRAKSAPAELPCMRPDVGRPDRIHIIGGMGTGKTYLGRRLASIMCLRVFEMDLGVDQDELLAQPSWISEGIYLWSIERVLEAADVVVWLDLPYRTCARRIVVRHALASARGNNRHKGLRKLWRFAWTSRRYWQTTTPRPPTGPTDWNALSRAQTVLTLDPHRSKVVRLSSRRAVDAWLSGVAHRWSDPAGEPERESRRASI